MKTNNCVKNGLKQCEACSGAMERTNCWFDYWYASSNMILTSTHMKYMVNLINGFNNRDYDPDHALYYYIAALRKTYPTKSTLIDMFLLLG